MCSDGHVACPSDLGVATRSDVWCSKQGFGEPVFVSVSGVQDVFVSHWWDASVPWNAQCCHIRLSSSCATRRKQACALLGLVTVESLVALPGQAPPQAHLHGQHEVYPAEGPCKGCDPSGVYAGEQHPPGGFSSCPRDRGTGCWITFLDCFYAEERSQTLL